MPLNQINLHRIEQTDALFRAIEKINFNFEQISLNGGGPTGKRGLTGLPGVSGPPGPAGIPGAKGDDGIRGSQWTTGNGSPASGTGAFDGDMYIDLTTSDIYQFDGSIWILMGSLGTSQGIAGNFFKKDTTSNTVTNSSDEYSLLLTSDSTETGVNIGGTYKLKVFNSGLNGNNIRLANQDARQSDSLWMDYSGTVINSFWNSANPQIERLIIQGLRNGDYSTHKQYASIIFDRISINKPSDNPGTNGPFFLLGASETLINSNDQKTYGIIGGPVRFVSNTTSGTDFNDGAFRWNTDHFEYFYSGQWNSFEQEAPVVDPVVSIVFDSLGSGPTYGLATITLSSQTSVFPTTSFQIKAMNGIGFSDETSGGPIQILGISGPGGGGGVSNSFSNVVVQKDGVTLSTLNSSGEDSFYLNIQDDLEVDVVGNYINISYNASSNSVLTPESMNFLGSRITYSSAWLHKSNELGSRLGYLPSVGDMQWGAEYLSFAQDPSRYEYFSSILASAWRADISPDVGLQVKNNRVSSWGWPNSSSDLAHKYQKNVLYTPIKQAKMGIGQLRQTAKLEYDFTDFKTSNAPSVSSLIDNYAGVANTSQYTDTVTSRNYALPMDYRRAPLVLNKIKSASSNDDKVSFYRVSVVAYAYVNSVLGNTDSSPTLLQELYTGLGSPIPIHTAVMVYDATVPWGQRIPDTAGPSPFYDSYYGDGSTYASPVIYSYLSTHTREVAPAQFGEGNSESPVFADYYALNGTSSDFVSGINLSKNNSVNTYNFKNTVMSNHVIKVESSDVVPLRYNEVAEVGFIMEKDYELSHPWGVAKDFKMYTSRQTGIPTVPLKIIRSGINVIYAHVNFELIGSNQL
jgi:hypothetical protein